MHETGDIRFTTNNKKLSNMNLFIDNVFIDNMLPNFSVYKYPKRKKNIGYTFKTVYAFIGILQNARKKWQ